MSKRSPKKSAKARALRADKRGRGRRASRFINRVASLGAQEAKRVYAQRGDYFYINTRLEWARESYMQASTAQLRLLMECHSREPNLKRVRRALMQGASFGVEMRARNARIGGPEERAFLTSAEQGEFESFDLWEMALRSGIDPLMVSARERWGFEFHAILNANQSAMRWWRAKGFPLDRLDYCGADVWTLCVERGAESLKAAMGAWPDAFSWEMVADRVYSMPKFDLLRVQMHPDEDWRNHMKSSIYDMLHRAPAISGVAMALIEAGVDYLRPSSELSDYMARLGADEGLVDRVKGAERERCARFEREQLSLSAAPATKSQGADDGEKTRSL